MAKLSKFEREQGLVGISRGVQPSSWIESVFQPRVIHEARKEASNLVKLNVIARTAEVANDEIDKRAEMAKADSTIAFEEGMNSRRGLYHDAGVMGIRTIGDRAIRAAQDIDNERRQKLSELEASNLPDEDKEWQARYIGKWAVRELELSDSIADDLAENVRETARQGLLKRD